MKNAHLSIKVVMKPKLISFLYNYTFQHSQQFLSANLDAENRTLREAMEVKSQMILFVFCVLMSISTFMGSSQ